MWVLDVNYGVMTAKQKVFLEFERIRDVQTGLGQVCWNVGKQFTQVMRRELELNCWLPKNKFNIFGKQFKYVAAKKGFRKNLLSYKNFAVWHCLHQGSKFLPKNKRTKLIITVQDLNFLFEEQDKRKRQQKKQALQKRFNRAQIITCISNYTKKVLQQHFSFNDQLITVVYLGVTIDFNIVPQQPHGLKKSKFIFTIGAISPKKNTHVLLAMLQKLANINLIIAGNAVNQDYMANILQQAAALGVAERVQFLGAVSEAEKYWLYQNCEAFAFPSLLEGFGLPVIEAMNFGKPVFLSTCTSLPEIGGAEAYYWDNFAPDYMADKFVQGMNDYNKDEQKSGRIVNWARQFTWEKTARQFIDLYTSD